MKQAKKELLFTPFEIVLWTTGVIGTLSSYFISTQKDPLNTAATLIGVTALIFVAKGKVLGQILTVIFALFYGAISLMHAYYGEMITYVGMSAPIALVSAIAWAKNPYGNTNTVKIRKPSGRELTLMWGLSVPVTLLIGLLLFLWNTPNLIVSTLSVTTSFLASWLSYLRSPYYALAYAANDVVLILLWGAELTKDPSVLPTLICFVIFLANDLYGFTNWKRMMKEQKDGR